MKLPTWRGKLPQWNGKKTSKDAWKASLRTRSFRVGGYSVAAAAIVVVIAVVANLLVNALPAGATQFDISAGSMFTMSQETEQLLDGLDQDITVYWLVQSGQEDETLGTLLDRYTSRSDRVTLEKRDPDVDPNFVQEYVTGTVYNNSLIVESEARYTYVSYEDIYTYEYGDDGASYYMNFAGESALTSAIDYVIRDTLPKLYTLTGHGESALSASFQSAVEKQNMELEELSLLTAEEVPEDADCLLICGPESDLSQEEKEAILAYLQEGGDLILLTDPAQTGEERPNLEELMAEYGMSSAQGVVVEGDPSHYALGSPVYLLPNLESHTITSPLQEGGYYILMALAQGLKLEEFPREGLSVSPLLTTSDEAYSKLAGYGMETYQKEEGDEAGPFALAAAATVTVRYTETSQVETNETDENGEPVYETQQTDKTFVLELGDYDGDTCYARLGGSSMVYQVDGTLCDAILAANGTDLLPQDVILLDWSQVTGVEIQLDGEAYTLEKTVQETTDEDGATTETYVYQRDGKTVEITDALDRLQELEPTGSDANAAGNKTEIVFTFQQDNASYPAVELAFYQYDSSSCLVGLNGETRLLVDRDSVLEIVDTVRELLTE